MIKIKKSLLKSSFRDITSTMSRFISIFGIVAVGVGFFTGLRATAPDMRLSGDSYFDEEKLMDFRLVSTIGFDENDVNALLSFDGAEVYAAYFADMIMENGGNDSVTRVMSLPENGLPMNYLKIEEGRFPENESECIINPADFGNGSELGRKITLKTTDNDKGMLTDGVFTIVGICSSPMYIDKGARGSTPVGNGELDSAVYILESRFDSEYFTEVYLRFDELYTLNCYGSEYNEKLDALEREIENTGEVRLETRFNAIKKEAEEKIAEAEAELYEKRAETESELNDARMKLDFAVSEAEKTGLGQNEIKIMFESAEKELEEAKKEAYGKLDEAQEEINDAKREVEELDFPKWYIFNRGDNPGYTEYDENADRIRGISDVFPIFFILVAALVCFTTMQRMVEENRLQIGTLKALGYGNGSIIFKYMLYALTPAVSGAVFGVLFGMKLFPNVVMTAYGIMYSVPVMEMPYDAAIALVAVLIMFISISVTVFSACYGELKERPSQLMRPKAPKNGKRVLLEHIPFIWNRLGFSQKVSLRNIFRYKRRMFMTVIGISGCTALLLTGFALYDCIGDVAKKQFGEIMTYTGLAATDSEITEIEEESIKKVFSDSGSGYVKFHQKQYDIKNGEKTLSVFICVPDNSGTASAEDMILFRNRETKEHFSIENGAVITEKAAALLGINKDDYVTVAFSDSNESTVQISGIAENYVHHYIYMTEKDYIEAFGEAPEYNVIYFKNELSAEENEILAEKLLENDGILTVSLTGGIENDFSGMMEALNMVIYVVIIMAGLLAFIVLYNLTNINITERIREIATLKVLGFYDTEVDRYVFRENLMLAALGAGAGLILGEFLARFVVSTAEINIAMFGREIYPSSYVLSALITLVFAAVVTLPMHFKLIGVNMAQSLKSVE